MATESGAGGSERGGAAVDAGPGVFGIEELIHKRYRVLDQPHAVPVAHIYDVENTAAGRKRHWVKVYWQESMMWQKVQLRITAELEEVLPRLSCPHFIQPISIDTLPDGRRYMVVEYAEGQLMLDAILHRDPKYPPVTVERAVHLALQLVDAVDLAYHDSQVLHCALNPTSIYLRSNWRLLIFDLQYAKVGDKSLIDTLDVASLPVEVLQYMAPEVVDDPRNADLISEMRSICANLYFWLCGEPPGERSTIPLRKRRIPGGYLPPRLDELVLRGLSVRRQDRFQSIEELRTALDEVHRVLRGVDAAGVVRRQPNLAAIGDPHVLAASEALTGHRRSLTLRELLRNLAELREEATPLVRAIEHEVEMFRNGSRSDLTVEENALLDAVPPKKSA